MNKTQVNKMMEECLFPDTCENSSLLETHISWVVLTDQFAFKIKRPVYIGDDVTDEDAFRTLYRKGLGILVGNHGDPSAAGYRLRDVDEVRELLDLLSARNK